MTLLKQIKIAFFLFILLMLMTGLIYPLLITGMAQLLMPWKANGSVIERNGIKIGSLLIGQYFSSNSYFWGRPSATKPFPYNSENSAGSNLGPTNPALLTQIKSRIEIFTKEDDKRLIPVDLVTASASGLDPEISPLAALYQIPRIAKARNISESDIRKLIEKYVKNRTIGVLGEERVNVLKLNMALDGLSKTPKE